MIKKNIFFALALVSILISYLTGCATTPSKDGAKSTLEDMWGVKVLSIRTTAAGRMLHFRYKIVDPEKASSLVSKKVKPYVIDLASNTKLSVPQLPKVGSLSQRTSNAKTDRIYFLLFSNPGKMIKPGDKVTIVIGDFKLENQTVE